MLNDPRIARICAVLAAIAVLAIGALTNSGSRADWLLYDRIVRSNTPPSDQIEIVAIDENSQYQLGAWPWPANVHATLVKRLTDAGAREIVFVTPLTGGNSNEAGNPQGANPPTDPPQLAASSATRKLREQLTTSDSDQDSEAQLAAAMAKHGNVVLGVNVELKESVPAVDAINISALATSLVQATPDAANGAPTIGSIRLPSSPIVGSAAAIGHTAFIADPDGTVRSDAAGKIAGDEILPSVALAAAIRALGARADQLHIGAGRRLLIDDRAVKFETGLRLRPKFFAAEGPTAFRATSYAEVLASRTAARQFRDKIVLVGLTVVSAGHRALTTPSNASSMPVHIVGATLSSMLQNTFYSRPLAARICEGLAWLAVLVIAGVVLPAVDVGFGAILLAVVIAALVVLEIGLLTSLKIWVPLLLPCLAAIASLIVFALLRRPALGKKQAAADPAEHLRTLAATFQTQGQLDLAFETLRRCSRTPGLLDSLYALGRDFERRQQYQKAAAVYQYMADYQPGYRDLQTRLRQVGDADISQRTGPPPMQRSASPLPAPESPDNTKKRLGRYEIERTLGKGAMGVVYLGRDPKINRVVAIKAIPLAEEFAEDDLADAKARFFREAEMAGRLNHPGIVIVFDAGEEDGLAYIAMEYLRGRHLSNYTEPGKLLPPRTVMLLIARVADALHYAHRQNVVHRDIKPANIMYDPQTDELKITDFGIARLTDTSRTKTGIVLGTPSFMSPEQLEGRNLDGRSDLFALGVSLFFLLTGQLPFRADSMTRLMHKIASEQHPSIRVLQPELPACVEEIVAKSLAKSSDDRYQSGAEMAAALRACASAAAASE